MGCNDNFEPNEEECNGCINWKYGTCIYEERRRIQYRGVAEMTYKEFLKWGNERTCDGYWGLCEAKSCLYFIDSIENNCKGIFKAKKKEKMFQNLYAESASYIVNATNKHIEELLKDD